MKSHRGDTQLPRAKKQPKLPSSDKDNNVFSSPPRIASERNVSKLGGTSDYKNVRPRNRHTRKKRAVVDKNEWETKSRNLPGHLVPAGIILQRTQTNKWHKKVNLSDRQCNAFWRKSATRVICVLSNLLVVLLLEIIRSVVFGVICWKATAKVFNYRMVF